MSEDDCDDEIPYQGASEIDPAGLRSALWSLYLLGDDPYLRMQAMNLSIVDPFIMKLEYEVLKKLGDEERTPVPEATFLSAQSQMWIFAAYELMRTWRQRAKEVIKWHQAGGLSQKVEALEQEMGFVHVGKKLRALQLRKIIAEPPLIGRIEADLRLTHMLFARLEHIRIALAKHEVGGHKQAVAYAPGIGRINRWCGSLDYEIEIRGDILGNISRRDIADEIRAISNPERAPTDEEIASFDAFMKGPPSRLS